MALGDQHVRDAAHKQDIKGFLDAVKAQGINPADKDAVATVVAVAEAGVWVSAVVAEYAAVSHFAATYVAAAYKVAVTVHSKLPVFLMEQNEWIRLATQLAQELGDPGFTRKVTSESMKRIIEEYGKLIIAKIYPSLLPKRPTKPKI